MTGDQVNRLIPEFTCRLPAGHRIGKAAPLFQKIEQALIDQLKLRFSGAQVGAATPATSTAATSPAGGAESDSLESLSQKVTQQVDNLFSFYFFSSRKISMSQVSYLDGLLKTGRQSEATQGGQS